MNKLSCSSIRNFLILYLINVKLYLTGRTNDNKIIGDHKQSCDEDLAKDNTEKGVKDYMENEEAFRYEPELVSSMYVLR